MDWEKQTAQNHRFWHITTFSAIESIQKHGLYQSEEGQTGKGLYAVPTDEDILEGAIDFLQQTHHKKELVIIEFTYSGTFYMKPVDAFVYANEGWCRIPASIPSSDILTFTPVSQLMQ